MHNTFHLFNNLQVEIDVALAPAHNVLNSMLLLSRARALPALPKWVPQTAAALSPEQADAQQLVLGGFGDALTPDADWPDFPAYLAHLAALPPEALRDLLLARLCMLTHSEQPSQSVAPRAEELLRDRAMYLASRAAIQPIDEPLEATIHDLLNNPALLRILVVSHLRTIWHTFVAEEWARQVPGLQNSIGEMRQQVVRAAWKSRNSEGSAAEQLQAFVSAQLSDSGRSFDGIERIVLVPSAHTGRYVTQLRSGATVWIFLHAPRFMSVIARTTPVRRSELFSRLNALADATCLQILELFARQDELTTQEIMARLSLTQSTTSRHLKQLSHFLIERRGQGASKVYLFAPAQIDLTFHAVKQVTEGRIAEPQPDASAQLPEELRRFVDEQGRITSYPFRQRALIHAFLAEQFAPGRTYTEREVNEILKAHIAFDDFVTLRRTLFDERYLCRERDGSRYWRNTERAERATQ